MRFVSTRKLLNDLHVHVVIPNIIVPLDVVLSLPCLILVYQVLHDVSDEQTLLGIVEFAIDVVTEHLFFLVVLQEGAFALHFDELIEDLLKELCKITLLRLCWCGWPTSVR